MGEAGFRHGAEGVDIVSALAEEPDLWDVNLSSWENDSQTARFPAGRLSGRLHPVRQALTTKPVVGVAATLARHDGRSSGRDWSISSRRGRQSPIRSCEQDPRRARRRHPRMHRMQHCASGANTLTPMRCTQNPTVGEEGRKGWHPEFLPRLDRPAQVLIVGGGPAELEAGRRPRPAGRPASSAAGPPPTIRIAPTVEPRKEFRTHPLRPSSPTVGFCVHRIGVSASSPDAQMSHPMHSRMSSARPARPRWRNGSAIDAGARPDEIDQTLPETRAIASATGGRPRRPASS